MYRELHFQLSTPCIAISENPSFPSIKVHNSIHVGSLSLSLKIKGVVNHTFIYQFFLICRIWPRKLRKPHASGKATRGGVSRPVLAAQRTKIPQIRRLFFSHFSLDEQRKVKNSGLEVTRPPLSSPALAGEFIPLLVKEGSFIRVHSKSSFPIASDERSERNAQGRCLVPSRWLSGRDGRVDNSPRLLRLRRIRTGKHLPFTSTVCHLPTTSRYNAAPLRFTASLEVTSIEHICQFEYPDPRVIVASGCIENSIKLFIFHYSLITPVYRYCFRCAKIIGGAPLKGFAILPIVLAPMPEARSTLLSPKRSRILSMAA